MPGSAKEGAGFQRLTWDALRKSLNGLVNKVKITNIKEILPEFFGEVRRAPPVTRTVDLCLCHLVCSCAVAQVCPRQRTQVRVRHLRACGPGRLPPST